MDQLENTTEGELLNVQICLSDFIKSLLKISRNEYDPQQKYLCSVIRVFVRDPVIVHNVIKIIIQ